MDSKPRRRRSMTIPGQVSSESIAHHSRPMKRTGRTRKGRLRSPRLATKGSRFRSAFFTTRTVLSIPEQLTQFSSSSMTGNEHPYEKGSFHVCLNKETLFVPIPYHMG